MQPATNNLRGALMALLAFAIYASHDVVVKALGGHYAAFQVVFFATLLGFPLVTIMMMRDRTDGNLRPRHPWWTALRTAALVLGGAASFYAFAVLPLAQTYAILFSMPLIITLLAIPILGERVRLRRGLAVLVGLVGVLIVIRPGSAALSVGHLAAVVGALGGALSSVIVRKIGHAERSAVLLLYPMMANVLVMGALLPFIYRPMPLADFGGFALLAVLALLAMMTLIAAYRRAEAVIVAPMQYSQMLWATFYGYVFFNEIPDLYTAIGATVIIASGLYIVMRESRGSTSKNRPVLRGRTRADSSIPARLALGLRRRGAASGEAD